MPVGTRASVRAVGPGELRAVGTDIVLANAFHLMLRPGDEVDRRVGRAAPVHGMGGPDPHRFGRVSGVLAQPEGR